MVVDSHAVTSEEWGLKAVPYSQAALAELEPSHLICLACDSATLQERIAARPEGRRAELGWKMDMINHAQIALALTYAHSLGTSAHIIDASVALHNVVTNVAKICGLSRVEL